MVQLPDKMRLDLAIDVNYDIVSKVALFQVHRPLLWALGTSSLIVPLTGLLPSSLGRAVTGR